jgi:itaconate CoA-transferase
VAGHKATESPSDIAGPTPFAPTQGPIVGSPWPLDADIDRRPDAEAANQFAPLAGIRIVAWEQAVAGPLATRHLADLGAEVIKIERPDGGDQARHYDTTVNGLSAHFVWLNRGKRSLVLDLKDPAGLRALHELLRHADVFVYNQGPGAADRLGIGLDELSRLYPALVQCAISGYGSDGPYRDRKAYDLLVQGEAGIMALTGSPDRPAKAGIPVADISAGMYALSSILAALYRRLRDGKGSRISVSMFDSIVEWAMAAAYVQLYTGHAPQRAGARHGFIVPYGPYRVADGYVNLAIQTQPQWERLCLRVLRIPGLIEDPRFVTNEARLVNRVRLEQLIEAQWESSDRAEVEALLLAADIPFGALSDLGDLVDHPQLAARQRWSECDSPVGPLRALQHPMDINDLPRRRARIPALGEDTDDILRELDAELDPGSNREGRSGRPARDK